MSETQTILTKFEAGVKKRLEQTKEMLKGFLTREHGLKSEPDQVEETSDETDSY